MSSSRRFQSPPTYLTPGAVRHVAPRLAALDFAAAFDDAVRRTSGPATQTPRTQ